MEARTIALTVKKGIFFGGNLGVKELINDMKFSHKMCKALIYFT